MGVDISGWVEVKTDISAKIRYWKGVSRLDDFINTADIVVSLFPSEHV